jgi:tetratricopeptide (TPR) repeat protein
MRSRELIFAAAALLAVLAVPALAQDDSKLCHTSEDAEEIIATCTRSIASGRWRGKDLAWAYTNRSYGFLLRKDYESAIGDANEAIRYDPNYFGAYNNRGNAHRARGELDRAFADYSQVLRLNPTYAIGYNNRGLVYEERGERDRAIADFRQAVRLDPNYRGARDNLRRLGVEP